MQEPRQSQAAGEARGVGAERRRGRSPLRNEIAARIVAHYTRTRRDLPWRNTSDPYAIWVSEIMLQQTRVATVIPYYQQWMQRFPTVAALAAAPLDDVLAAWAGLGYYSRARNLHRGAREVVDHHGGRVPDTAAGLRALPGIGRYTAGAIASLAYRLPEPVVDGNVARVLARVFELEDDIKAPGTQRRLWELATELVPPDAPSEFNQGMMELGATVCTPRNPRCEPCPVRDACRAHANGRQHELPVTARRPRADELPLIATAAAWIVRRNALLLARRRPSGLYGGLWELPQADHAGGLADALGVELRVGTAPVTVRRQQLTHRRLCIEVWPARVIRGRVRPDPERYDRATWQPLARLDVRGVSSATARIIQQYRESSGWKTT